MCFDNKILRGNRTIKQDAGSFFAFTSPNLPPIATLEIRIDGNISLFGSGLVVLIFSVLDLNLFSKNVCDQSNVRLIFKQYELKQIAA